MEKMHVYMILTPSLLNHDITFLVQKQINSIKNCSYPLLSKVILIYRLVIKCWYIDTQKKANSTMSMLANTWLFVHMSPITSNDFKKSVIYWVCKILDGGFGDRDRSLFKRHPQLIFRGILLSISIKMALNYRPHVLYGIQIWRVWRPDH